ncbi:MAG: F0F1 ATP synthase subunit A, partial [Cyclobacteriaceae bacterium]
NNLLGLLPGAANVTGNISITLTLAFLTFIITQFSGNKYYWQHVFNTPGVPAWLLPIMIPVEIIGLFTKPFSLMVRLFANITAGHIIILSIIGLVFIFESLAVGVVSVLFATVMNFLELLVAFLQAFVFTLLSAIYFGGAVEEHHHEEGKVLEGEHDRAPLQSDSAMV